MEDENMLDEQTEDTAEETANEAEEEAEYEEEDTSDDGAEEDADELEYDEDGNVILPDEDGEDEDGAESDDEDAEEGEEKPKTDEQEAKYRRLEAQARDTLSKLGEDLKDGEDVLDALERIAAETEGLSKAEYRKRKQEADELEAAKKLLKNMEYEKKAQGDLAVLHSEFPDTKQYKHLREMPAEVLKKFARFRDLGLEPKEAYAAANPDGIRTGAANSARQRAQNNGKGHLTSAVPKRASDHSTVISKSMMAQFRALPDFEGMSDKEIIEIYKMTKEN